MTLNDQFPAFIFGYPALGDPWFFWHGSKKYLSTLINIE